jgi:hypothetical protein
MELSDGSLRALKLNDLVVGALGDRGEINKIYQLTVQFVGNNDQK